MNTLITLKEAAARSGVSTNDLAVRFDVRANERVDLSLLKGEKAKAFSDLSILQRGTL